MATRVLTDCKLWLAGYDLSGDHNALGLDYAAEMVDDTVFGDDTRSNKGGLKTLGFNHEGLWEGGDDNVDDVLFSRVGLEDELMSIGPETGADGENGYFGPIAIAEYVPSGAVGEMFAFTVSGEASDPLTRGTIMFNSTGVTSSGSGTNRQLGAVGASEKLYAGLHVLASGGDSSQTLDVTVESDSADDFTGSETTRITFTQATTSVTSEWATPVDGAISDDWWRVNYTIGGTGSPSFDFVVLVAIQ